MRRQILQAFAVACMPRLSFGRPSEEDRARQRLLGTWRSDRERSLRSFSFQGKTLTEAQEGLFNNFFGRMTWTFTATTYSYQIEPMPVPELYRYFVTGATDSSASLTLVPIHADDEWQTLTVYFDGNAIFARSGLNFEYFRRVSG